MPPNLEPLPDHRIRRIVVGTTVRKPLAILQAYLQSLDWQERPRGVAFDFAFVPDFAPDQQDALQYLLRWVNERGGKLIQGVPAQGPDFSDAAGLDSHQWQASAMQRVGANKNLLIQYALQSGAEAIWFADADLIMEPTTFTSLDAAEKPIATAVYWTKWSKRGTETRKIQAAPQVWLTHPYGLSGRGYDETEFRQKLLSRGVTRVWGFGACTLIRRNVLEAGVDFSYLPDVPMQGLMAGEDRHFCIRAERAHIESVADTWPDIFHVYHGDEDVPRIPEMLARVGARHPLRARLGDLVSCRLRPLEPVAVGPGRYSHVQPQLLRGRLGCLAVQPEIEEALYGLARGHKAIVRVHFPSHYPAAYLRGRTRLIEVTLIDTKPMQFPPTVDEELYVGQLGGSALDHTTLTQPQHESIREVSA